MAIFAPSGEPARENAIPGGGYHAEINIINLYYRPDSLTQIAIRNPNDSFLLPCRLTVAFAEDEAGYAETKRQTRYRQEDESVWEAEHKIKKRASGGPMTGFGLTPTCPPRRAETGLHAPYQQSRNGGLSSFYTIIHLQGGAQNDNPPFRADSPNKTHRQLPKRRKTFSNFANSKRRALKPAGKRRHKMRTAADNASRRRERATQTDSLNKCNGCRQLRTKQNYHIKINIKHLPI